MQNTLCAVGFSAIGLALLAVMHWRMLRWHTRCRKRRLRVVLFAGLLGSVGLWCLVVASLGGN